ncbi:hypothetical protein [Clostridium sp. AM33-3]|uniref:hypothetical protein n=1 Tax=Clostridium sp. AM33-3 TaxID=2292304 RepID=UPI000E4DA3BC|nr:hypothetical protein [Clostridium sp. AM33-3]RHT20988.1 hypothetical protein DW819_08670 [Clostridium sp. AM33-3]
MEITKREIGASVTIVAVMMIIGFLVAGRIEAWQIKKNAEYYTALQITSPEQFQYGMDTSVGNAFVYGVLRAVDPVTYPEIGGAYLYAEKEEEHYNRHTRTVTETDSQGKTHTRTEVYWTWDYYDSWNIYSQRINFLDVEMDYRKITRPSAQYIDTIQTSAHVRFNYYGAPAECEGTIYTDLRDGTISDNTQMLVNTGIEDAVKEKTRSYTWMFWILWMILTGAAVYGFCYLDNDWLNLD